MLSIRLLGGLEVARDGVPLELPRSRKTRALLAYLILSSRPQRRERLCELFWEIPDDPRAALRWSLSRIRPLVNDAQDERIVSEGDAVRFEPHGADIDVLAVANRAPEALEGLSTDELKSLDACFVGDVLEGLDMPECPDFQAWVVAQREDFKALHCKALAALTARHEDLPGEALHYARSWVRADPDSAHAHGALIALLAAAGREKEAEAQFQAAADILAAQGRRSVADVLAAQSAMAPADTGGGRPPIDQDIRFCTASDGISIAFATVGRGPPLVKASNWLTHLEYDLESPVWRHWIAGLSRNHTLIRYDERGSGLSDWDVEEISFEGFVDDLDAVADAASLDRFPLLGISRGCAIAIAYAARHPERVTALILYGGFSKGWRLRGSPETVARGEALFTLMKHGWGQENPAFRQVFTSLFMPGGAPEQMDWFNELMRISTTPDNAVRLRSASASIDVENLLPRIAVPTLIAHCRGDAVSPFEEGRKLARAIPGARFIPLESRNHLLREDEPAWTRFLTEVQAFLADMKASAP